MEVVEDVKPSACICGFHFRKPTLPLSLSSPPELSLLRFDPFLPPSDFRRFRPPTGVPPVTRGALPPSEHPSSLGFPRFGRKTTDRSLNHSGCSLGLLPIPGDSGHLRSPFLRRRFGVNLRSIGDRDFQVSFSLQALLVEVGRTWFEA
ncbi:hypothetical protein RchiOBHm_Chr6g0263681 [Rosa chinensis]|uniref:Uncharacterized protein n=1 Tax=Rosa chinensis TaxID=74649 RepID=A0A2P6PNZ5_ROSCH|nr:hypothetical protein RchiOBHm_Chr6g0263681 [Rosa chinensis]